MYQSAWTAILRYDKAANAIVNKPVSEPIQGSVFRNPLDKIIYQWDEDRQKWLSINTHKFMFGRNGFVGNGEYLPLYGGDISSIKQGIPADKPATIISLDGRASEVSTFRFKIVKNDLLNPYTFLFVNNTKSEDDDRIDFDLSERDYIQVLIESSGLIDTPKIFIEIAYRYVEN